MLHIVQDSRDGINWRNFSFLGKPLVFKGKVAAKTWWEDFIDSNSPDWRVGFLVRFRDGQYYRIVNSKGQQVKS